MQVLARALAPDVSITLVCERDEHWRFVSWMVRRGMLEDPLPPPPPESAEQRFADVEEAVAFFRSICPYQP